MMKTKSLFLALLIAAFLSTPIAVASAQQAPRKTAGTEQKPAPKDTTKPAATVQKQAPKDTTMAKVSKAKAKKAAKKVKGAKKDTTMAKPKS